MSASRFHGRVESAGRRCEAPGCREAGEFRAPGRRPNGFDGPGEWRWFCLQHVREFNAGYDWFEGMSAEEILHAQSPIAGWRTESRAFRPTAGIDEAPRWADYSDPLDAISARARGIPVITWTVRYEKAREHTYTYADQMTFEGFDPKESQTKTA